MSVILDAAALATLRAMLRAAVMSMTSGLHHLPKKQLADDPARKVLIALDDAFQSLRRFDEATGGPTLDDTLEIVVRLARTFAPLEVEVFGPIELYRRSVSARIPQPDRRGAPVPFVGNVVRMPLNGDAAFRERDEREAADEALCEILREGLTGRCFAIEWLFRRPLSDAQRAYLCQARASYLLALEKTFGSPAVDKLFLVTREVARARDAFDRSGFAAFQLSAAHSFSIVNEDRQTKAFDAELPRLDGIKADALNDGYVL